MAINIKEPIITNEQYVYQTKIIHQEHFTKFATINLSNEINKEIINSSACYDDGILFFNCIDGYGSKFTICVNLQLNLNNETDDSLDIECEVSMFIDNKDLNEVTYKVNKKIIELFAYTDNCLITVASINSSPILCNFINRLITWCDEGYDTDYGNSVSNYLYNSMWVSNLKVNSSISLNRKPDTKVGSYSIAIGGRTEASESYSFAEGYITTASGKCSHAEGNNTFALGEASHAEGSVTFAYGDYSHAEGSGGTKFSFDSNNPLSVLDLYTKWKNASIKFPLAYGKYAHTEGFNCITLNNCTHAEGYENVAYGYASHAEGYNTKALAYQHAQGHYNNDALAKANNFSGTSTGTAFVIGNGTSSTLSNAFRVTGQGVTYSKGAYNSTGADYAEFAEWADGNPDNEDRRGYFVTYDENKPNMIRKANADDDYILGVISANPCIIGNADEGYLGMYCFDEFGSIIYEEKEEEETYIDEKTGEEKTRINKYQFYKINPNYDPDKTYEHRADRKEWDYVGWLGVLSVRDNGTCIPGKYCKVADGGIATACNNKEEISYRVLERITDNVVKVAIKH